MAGSEGIDFKFIRQVHILEPWFNINRIDIRAGNPNIYDKMLKKLDKF